MSETLDQQVHQKRAKDALAKHSEVTAFRQYLSHKSQLFEDPQSHKRKS